MESWAEPGVCNLKYVSKRQSADLFLMLKSDVICHCTLLASGVAEFKNLQAFSFFLESLTLMLVMIHSNRSVQYTHNYISAQHIYIYIYIVYCVLYIP